MSKSGADTGQWFRLKSEAKKKAESLRRSGNTHVYTRKYRYGKGRKNNGKGDLGWMVNW